MNNIDTQMHKAYEAIYDYDARWKKFEVFKRDFFSFRYFSRFYKEGCYVL